MLLSWIIAAPRAALAEDLQIGLSSESVSITSNFDGENIVVFGSIEDGNEDDLTNARYDIVVALVGPLEDVVVRRKDKKFGIWINGASTGYTKVPSFYSLASNRPLPDIAAPALLSRLELGFDNLLLAHPKDIGGQLGLTDPNFRSALSRLKASQSRSLARPTGVKFLSKTLFRARLAVPANVPIGRHTARAYLFKRGEFLLKKSARLAVRKTGFEQYTYNFAHKHGLLYGLMAVLVAMATGWLASVIFRKD